MLKVQGKHSRSRVRLTFSTSYVTSNIVHTLESFEREDIATMMVHSDIESATITESTVTYLRRPKIGE